MGVTQGDILEVIKARTAEEQARDYAILSEIEGRVCSCLLACTCNRHRAALHVMTPEFNARCLAHLRTQNFDRPVPSCCTHLHSRLHDAFSF